MPKYLVRLTDPTITLSRLLLLMRNLVLILGDQLDAEAAVWDDFSPEEDAVWMAEVPHETTHVWCHQQRIALFFSAMRHFREELRQRGFTVHYTELGERAEDDRGATFSELLAADLTRLAPRKVIVTLPGDYRVLQELQQTTHQAGLELEVQPDRHFYCTPEEFAWFAHRRKELRLEYFYRFLRKRENILLDSRGKPTGGAWNYDHDNRDPFSRTGPPDLPPQRTFAPNEITRQVLKLVRIRFAEHPGSLEDFSLPVTRAQARKKLQSFIQQGLALFGRYEDAMWTGEPVLYHSHLSACLNLKLLSPRECVQAALEAYAEGLAPLNSVEGFVRQILGWREFVRGVYWLLMPEYQERNALGQHLDVPSFFWDGNTEMNCVRESMQHVLRHGYTHHIQRLMVLGNLAQTLGVHPLKFHEWHMALYVDAIDWVSLPNTLGMSQYGDGGVIGTKPYCATGNYVHRMSNYCQSCRFNHKSRHGPDACPLTTLYWDFLARHEETLRDNPRMKFPMKNLERLREQTPEELAAIRAQAEQLRKTWYS